MDKELRQNQNHIADLLIIFFTIAVVPGVAISLSRISSIGFQPEMAVHLALAGIVVFLALFRKRTPYTLKALIAVGAFMAVGYSGFLSIGLSSSGRLDVVISIALVCMFFGIRAGLVMGGVNTALVAAIAFLHVNGTLEHNIDFNAYNTAAKSWIAALYNFIAMGVVVVLLHAAMEQRLRKIISNLINQKQLLTKEVAQRIEAENRYKTLSDTDPLTNLYNRRYFFEKASVEIDRSKRYGRDLSVIIMDADNFKILNDTYGHIAGDEVLKNIAHIIKDAVRPADLSCRFGGEEFCILMPETDADNAVVAAERIRTIIEQGRVENNDIRFSCSFGVTEMVEEDASVSDVISRADRALYLSKSSGRNRVTKLI